MVDCVNAEQGSYLSQGCAGGYLEEVLAYASRQDCGPVPCVRLGQMLRAATSCHRCTLHRSWFITKEDTYPFTSGEEGMSGACNKDTLANVRLADKVQLVGGGFKQLRQWSAAALREVRARLS